MIQLSDDALLVCYADGKIEPLTIGDLIAQISQGSASEEPPALDPWLMEKVVESIVHHFREELQRDQVPLDEFVALARQLLEDFFREAKQNGQNLIQMDLMKVATDCGTGFELEFFARVKNFILEKSITLSGPQVPVEETAAPEALTPRTLRLTGLRSCAKYLTGKQRWSKNCSRTRDEIVSFIRAELTKIEGLDQVNLVLS